MKDVEYIIIRDRFPFFARRKMIRLIKNGYFVRGGGSTKRSVHYFLEKENDPLNVSRFREPASEQVSRVAEA